MADSSFSGAVDAWVLETKARQEAIFKTAAQYVAEDVIDRVPVDTGFLRASFTASLVEPPQIRPDATPPKDAGKGSIPPAENYSLVIANSKLGDTIHFGFVAAYALYVEYGTRGRKGALMVGLSVQRWPQHVAKAVRAAKAAVASRSKK